MKKVFMYVTESHDPSLLLCTWVKLFHVVSVTAAKKGLEGVGWEARGKGGDGVTVLDAS